MKKKNIIILASLLLIAIVTILLILFYPVSTTDADLASIIPKNATSVVRINMKSLFEKSNYRPLNNKALKAYLDNARKDGNDQVQENVSDLEKFLKNPDSFGINVSGNCFIYNDSSATGIIWGINDRKRVKKALSDVFGLPEDLIKKEGEIYSASLNNYISLTWDKAKVLVLVNTKAYLTHLLNGAPVDLKGKGEKQIKSSAANSILSNPQFNKFLKDSQDISLFSSEKEMLSKGLSEQMNFGPQKLFSRLFDSVGGVYTAVFFSFERGKISVSQKNYYDNKSSEDKFKSLISHLTGNIKGEQLKYFTTQPLFMLSMNMKGEKVYAYLSEKDSRIFNGKGSSIPGIGMNIDLKTILSSIDGDITFAVNDIGLTKKEFLGFAYTEQNPEYTLMVDVKGGTTLLNSLTKKLSGMKEFSVSKTSPLYYTLISNGRKFYIGLKNGTFFYTANEEMLKNILSDKTTLEYKNMIRNKKMFLYGNPELAGALIDAKKMDGNTKNLLKSGLGLFGIYIYTVENDLSGSGEIRIKEKKQNSLSVIFNYIDKVITFYAGKGTK